MQERIKDNYLQLSAGLVSVATALCLFGFKMYYALASGSVGVLASALDSAFDIVSSLIILVAVIAAAKPADHDHRYGHGKAEALAGFVQSILIAFVALYIIYRAWVRFNNPQAVSHIPESLLVMTAATIATFFLITFQDYVARRTGSIAIKADRIHYLTDMLSNVLIIGSLLLEKFFRMQYADLITGIALSIYIMKCSIAIFRESFGVLMDRDISHLYTDFLDSYLQNHRPEVLGYHDLRARSAGNLTFLEFHLEMNKELTFERSHHIVESLIHELRKNNRKLEVSIHSDPAELDRSSGQVMLLDDESPRQYMKSPQRHMELP